MSPSLLCYPLSIVIVNSCHPSTLQADAHSSGGGACCHRHHSSIVVVDSYHPSTLQVDTRSSGGGACRRHCHSSIVIVDSHHPSTLQADARSGGGGACCHCRCLVLAFHPQVHPPPHEQLLKELGGDGVLSAVHTHTLRAAARRHGACV